ncbi:N-6 DNA methylase [Helicobacter sp. 23-1045]
MQQMLLMFNYLKRYHSDILDVLCIALGFINLKIHAPDDIRILLNRAKKRKEIGFDINIALQNLLGNLYVAPNNNVNFIKILRMVDEINPTNSDIESFINTISQKQTINKLYAFSTPLEINHLIADILDLSENDEIYNPCYGIGSLFLALTHKARHFSIYGEELDMQLDRVARLILKAIKIDASNLFVNNILKKQIFPPNRKFSKIICHPPRDIYIGILDLKHNERFAQWGLITKSVPELSFIINGISYLRDKGVFILRNQILKKTSVEEKFKEILCQKCLIEAIIELPNNIFPHDSAEFSLMVISKNNDGILHIDASNFHKKEGKYNHLTNTQQILEILRNRQNSQYSKFTPYSQIDIDDLRVQNYLLQQKKTPKHSIKSIGVKIFRGVRIYSTKESNAQSYTNIGIVNFNEYGFIDCEAIEAHIGDKDKIEKNKLRAFDVLLSLRGVHPKITIVNKSKNPMVANAGIIVLRAKSEDEAYGLFCFLFSKRAQNLLRDLCVKSERKSININELYDIEIPQDFARGAKEKFMEINKIGSEIIKLHKKIENLR